MATLVGTQNKLTDALQSLIELDYDAIEAYQTAIERLETETYKSKLLEFCTDHKQHIELLSSLLKDHGIKPPTGPSAKQWLTKGKVVLADMVGDNTILRAMLSNEQDTNKAYENMNERDDIGDKVEGILKQGLEDERKHKEWLEKTLKEARDS